MNSNLTYARSPTFSITVFAALAAFITIGLLTSVAYLFQHEGRPLEAIAAAERACVQHAYVSEREDCMQKLLAAAHSPKVASR